MVFLLYHVYPGIRWRWRYITSSSGFSEEATKISTTDENLLGMLKWMDIEVVFFGSPGRRLISLWQRFSLVIARDAERL